MGLRLKFTLSATGTGSREELRADAASLARLLEWLEDESLLEPPVAAQYEMVTTEGRVVRGAERSPLADVVDRLRSFSPDALRTVDVWGLRTSDRFPNAFHAYTSGEEALSAWLAVRVACSPQAHRRELRLEFTEVAFSDDSPLIPWSILDRQLQGLLGARWTSGCFSDEPEPTPP